MIYLDHHAATPLRDSVWQAMAAVRECAWPNALSVHRMGQGARTLLERARRQVANVIHAHPADVIFTSGGTEACNLGVLGMLSQVERVIANPIEHPAVRCAVELAASQGNELQHLPLSAEKLPGVEQLEQCLSASSSPALVVCQWVNHEVGTLFPIDAYAQVCKAHRALLFVDASQALGKVPIDVHASGADAIAFAAYKLGGPSGSGALWCHRDVALQSHACGGAQERGRRAGTHDVLAHVGFGAACQEIDLRLADQERLRELQYQLEEDLLAMGARLNGADLPRVASVVNASFPAWPSERLVTALDIEGVCVSSGAACSSGVSEASPVISALYPEDSWRATHCVRWSFGSETTADDLSQALQILKGILERRS